MIRLQRAMVFFAVHLRWANVPTDRLSCGPIAVKIVYKAPAAGVKPFGAEFDELISKRRDEADEFYKSVTPATVSR